MATYQRLASGHWRARIDMRTADGTRRRVSRTAATKAELRRIVADLELHGAPTSTTMTVDELIAKWLDGPARTRLDESSHSSTTYDARSLISPRLGNVRLDRLTVDAIDQAYADMLAAGYAPRTVGRAHGILSTALTQGTRWGAIRHNVARDTSPPSAGRREVNPPSPDEVKRLLERSRTKVIVDRRPWWPAFMRLAAATGARKGELLGARFEDFTGDQWRISRSIARGRGGAYINVNAKTAGSIRTIRLDATTVATLEAWRDRFGAVDGWLWPGANDALPVSSQTVSKAWYRTRELADIGRRVRFHDLRHAHATTLLSEGFDVRTVAGRLGHQKVATLLDIYAAWIPARDDAAASHIGDLLD